MYRILDIILVVLIMGASIASCEEAAYAFGESGAIRLDQYSLSKLNGSEIATFSVTTGSRDTSSRVVCPIQKSLSDIKSEIERRVEVGNPTVKNEADFLALKFPGEHSVEQVCAIFEYIEKNWNYTGDAICEEYYKYANETIRLGNRSGCAGAGDCDDFAILISALIESIGGRTRINLAYDDSKGHAYTEVYIGQYNNKSDNNVNKTILWLRNKYKTNDIYVHIDNESNNVWLNLDWWADHPGGPYYKNYNHKKMTYIRQHIPIVELNSPNIAPIAIFFLEPEATNAREIIIFDASQSLDPFGEIIDYEWSFGDGGTDYGPVVNHTYQVGDTYPVMLKVTDDEGEPNSSTTVIKVNEPPVAQFSYSVEDIKSGYIIIFNASESYDKDGYIDSYTWNFGDGKTAEKLQDNLATNFYPNYGTFIVSLTVKDNNNATGVKSIPIKINVLPIAKIFINNSEPNIGEEISLDASESTDSDGNITEYLWDFGDRNTAVGENVSYNYSTYGTFTVKLEVKDNDNSTASAESEIYVNKPPVASFTYIPAAPTIGDLITFVSNSWDDDGTITTNEWEFGDGNTATKVPVVDHTYNRYGCYNVTLTVTDNNGAQSSKSTKLILGLNITSHKNGDLVAPSINVSGNYPLDLKEDIWIFVKSPYGLLYPQSMNSSIGQSNPKSNRTWYTQIWLGNENDVGEPFDIVLTIANINTSNNISDYLKEGYNPDGDCDYQGFESLPEGVIELDRITVIRLPIDVFLPEAHIDYPSNGAIVQSQETMNGTVKGYLSEQHHLWVIGRCLGESESKWWPQGTEIEPFDGNWKTEIYFGGGGGETYNIHIIAVTEDGNEYVKKHVADWIPSFPADSRTLDEVNVTLDSKDADAWYNKGNALMNQGKFEEAIQAYDEAIRLDPEYADAWNGKGNAFNDMHRYDEAIRACDEAIRLNPEYAKPWNSKGVALMNLEKFDEAIEAYDKAIDLDPEFAWPWYNKGDLLANYLGRYDEAIKAYDEAVDLDPEFALAWNKKGIALAELGKYDEAIKAYDEAINLDPKNTSAYNLKGKALEALGRTSEANEFYIKAQELESSG